MINIALYRVDILKHTDVQKVGKILHIIFAKPNQKKNFEQKYLVFIKKHSRYNFILVLHNFPSLLLALFVKQVWGLIGEVAIPPSFDKTVVSCLVLNQLLHDV